METEELKKWCRFIQRCQKPETEEEKHRDLLVFHIIFSLVDKFTVSEIWGALPREYQLMPDTPDLWAIRWWLEDWIEELAEEVEK